MFDGSALVVLCLTYFVPGPPAYYNMIACTVSRAFMACWSNVNDWPYLLQPHIVLTRAGTLAGVYDAADTKRFYITALNYELDQGVHLGNSQLLIASSISSNPADGFLGPYAGSCLTSPHLGVA